MGELEKLVEQTEQAIRATIQLRDFHPGKVSVWIKLVKHVLEDGCTMEQSAGGVHKVLFTAGSEAELVHQVADNLVLTIFGSDVQVVKEMPNLIVKLFDQKAHVSMPGAPPLDQAGQVYLKATVYRWEPSLWDQFFKRQSDAAVHD